MLVSEHDYQRTLEYSFAALGMLKRAKIPPYPHFYELCYTYASGINEQLNERLNMLLGEDNTLSMENVLQVYREFFDNPSDLESRLTSVSQEMSSKIDAVNRAMDDAIDTAEGYSGSLDQAEQQLLGAIDQEALRILANKLLAETHKMQEANKNLEEKLKVSKQDISSLKRDLDTARRETMLDPLTKIANRKSFDQRLKQVLEISKKTGTTFCLLMMDIDHFKAFNDNYGHQTGDQVLRLVAMTLKSNLKGRDHASRFGGEEFAAILPDTDIRGARLIAEKIRKAVHAKELLKRSTNEKLGRITVSIGAAQYRHEESIPELIERADGCLYTAKRTGRNRVVCETDDEFRKPKVA
ncbi:diguanylate cyclase [Maritalea mobilis]|uniref:diguanylate cyclase n=1 Tax=Maritalea mobilis TaxID=483324 RepID=A0A4R6VQV5_9HYPH|nr:GGDEF domain-containing protein [Maritalea mobilis]TDQ66413.1 diguanylate cyclase [Maritalea mobilis]